MHSVHGSDPAPPTVSLATASGRNAAARAGARVVPQVAAAWGTPAARQVAAAVASTRLRRRGETNRCMRAGEGGLAREEGRVAVGCIAAPCRTRVLALKNHCERYNMYNTGKLVIAKLMQVINT